VMFNYYMELCVLQLLFYGSSITNNQFYSSSKRRCWRESLNAYRNAAPTVPNLFRLDASL
jgi:hypothetical protein